MRRRSMWKRVVARLVVFVSALLAFQLSLNSASADPPGGAKREKQRKAIEAILDQDVQWDVGDAKTVTLEQFIVHVRAKHGLSICWDVSTFRGMVDGSGSEFNPLGLFSGVAPRSASAEPSANDRPTLTPYASTPAASIASVPPPAAIGPTTVFKLALGEPKAEPATAETAPDVKASPLPLPLPAAEPKPTDDLPLPADAPKPDAAPAESIKPASSDEKSDEAAQRDEAESIEPYLPIAQAPIARANLSLETGTVGEVLQQMLEAVSMPLPLGEMGIPLATQATKFDYLIEGRTVLITTHMQVAFRKETRVYAIGHLKSLPADELARAITRSVRPWSWRIQSADVAQKLVAALPKKGQFKFPTASINVTQAMQLVSDGDLGDAAIKATAPQATQSVSAEDIAAFSQFVAGAATAAWDVGLAAIEMLYHGEPPTATIETLPGVLIINQSQSAHREIEDLIEQLTLAGKANEAK